MCCKICYYTYHPGGICLNNLKAIVDVVDERLYFGSFATAPASSSLAVIPSVANV
jgi:hypothetical protein